jgi:membrane protein DedA with SNARE-associated domain
MANWIIYLMTRTGYGGLVALMLLENVFPPIPSEVIVPLGGYLAQQGRLTLLGVVVAGTLGAVLGALPLYWLGRRIGEGRLKRWVNRHGRWLALSCADLDRAAAWFGRHGTTAVLIGRLVPGVRSLISVPAGIQQMPLGRFLLYTTLGSAVWTTALAAAGYGLGQQFRQVGEWLDPVSWVVLGGVAAAYLWRVARWRPEQSAVGGAE